VGRMTPTERLTLIQYIKEELEYKQKQIQESKRNNNRR